MWSLLRINLLVISTLMWSRHGFSYEEESFGNINPDKPATPKKTDVYTRRDDPSEDLPSEPKPPKQQEKSRKPRPKYRDEFSQPKESKDYGDNESVGVSVGVGFGFKSFSGSLGLTFPLNRFLAWGLGGFYSTYETKNQGETRYGGEITLIAKLPNPTPLTPFVSTGPGYELWTRKSEDGNGFIKFDEHQSPTFVGTVGASLRLARYISLVGGLKSTYFIDRAARSFDGDHSVYDKRSQQKFELGFAFGF